MSVMFSIVEIINLLSNCEGHLFTLYSSQVLREVLQRRIQLLTLIETNNSSENINQQLSESGGEVT